MRVLTPCNIESRNHWVHPLIPVLSARSPRFLGFHRVDRMCLSGLFRIDSSLVLELSSRFTKDTVGLPLAPAVSWTSTVRRKTTFVSNRTLQLTHIDASIHSQSKSTTPLQIYCLAYIHTMDSTELKLSFLLNTISNKVLSH